MPHGVAVVARASITPIEIVKRTLDLTAFFGRFLGQIIQSIKISR